MCLRLTRAPFAQVIRYRYISVYICICIRNISVMYNINRHVMIVTVSLVTMHNYKHNYATLLGVVYQIYKLQLCSSVVTKLWI